MTQHLDYASRPGWKGVCINEGFYHHSASNNFHVFELASGFLNGAK
jgi:hypothetical protein